MGQQTVRGAERATSALASGILGGRVGASTSTLPPNHIASSSASTEHALLPFLPAASRLIWSGACRRRPSLGGSLCVGKRALLAWHTTYSLARATLAQQRAALVYGHQVLVQGQETEEAQAWMCAVGRPPDGDGLFDLWDVQEAADPHAAGPTERRPLKLQRARRRVQRRAQPWVHVAEGLEAHPTVLRCRRARWAGLRASSLMRLYGRRTDSAVCTAHKPNLVRCTHNEQAVHGKDAEPATEGDAAADIDQARAACAGTVGGRG